MRTRILRATAAALAAASLCAPAANAEPATPQAIDAHAEFLAYAPAPPTPVKVCVVDTGVDRDTDVDAAVVDRLSVSNGAVEDGGGGQVAKHGTYVAGIIASQPGGSDSVGICRGRRSCRCGCSTTA